MQIKIEKSYFEDTDTALQCGVLCVRREGLRTLARRTYSLKCPSDIPRCASNASPIENTFALTCK